MIRLLRNHFVSLSVYTPCAPGILSSGVCTFASGGGATSPESGDPVNSSKRALWTLSVFRMVWLWQMHLRRTLLFLFFFPFLPFVLLFPIVFQLVLHVIPQDDMINGPGASDDDDDDYRHRLIMTIIATICYCNAVTAPSNLLFFPSYSPYS